MMRRLLLPLALLLAAVFPLRADDPKQARPNTLSPKEIADGWLLLFDGETTFGWKVDGEAKVADGLLILGGNKETTATLDFGFFDAYWELRWDGDKRPERIVKALKGSRETNRAGGEFSYSSANGKVLWTRENWKIKADPEIVGTVSLAKGSSDKGTEVDTTISMPLQDRTLVQVNVPKGTKLYLRNVKLKPTGMKPIFYGKDLTGWKEIPGKKSKFTVTAKGELNVKDGPGDLQTEGQWDDFVLQLDVFSNGPHLNSGVFFRCLPGKFWSGYEAQIRNQWEGDDRAKPVDYGTGGIYNRQPARKVVSSDHEWFTMTVVARGKHLAVWVNGYQTADFTDTRPVGENARQNCKVDKGPISLQGHDKTTDLSFRNIRLAALAKAE